MSRVPAKQHLLADLPISSIPDRRESPCGCRLPINLRSFLAEQLGCQAEADDDAILSYAARADQLTLNKLARAIRRYSTARSREAWVECRVPVGKVMEACRQGSIAVLCLRCARIELTGPSSHQHRGSGCVPISLTRGERQECGSNDAGAVAENIQRLVEEFRALRAAFGLPHFDLDCYLRGEHLTLMWRPLP